MQRARGHDHVDLVVEHDEAEPVGRVESRDEGVERRQGGIEAAAGHRAAAVEHDLQRCGRAHHVRLRLRGGQLEQDRDLVLLLDGHEVDVEMGVEMHVRRPLRGH